MIAPDANRDHQEGRAGGVTTFSGWPRPCTTVVVSPIIALPFTYLSMISCRFYRFLNQQRRLSSMLAILQGFYKELMKIPTENCQKSVKNLHGTRGRSTIPAGITHALLA